MVAAKVPLCALLIGFSKDPQFLPSGEYYSPTSFLTLGPLPMPQRNENTWNSGLFISPLDLISSENSGYSSRADVAHWEELPSVTQNTDIELPDAKTHLRKRVRLSKPR